MQQRHTGAPNLRLVEEKSNLERKRWNGTHPHFTSNTPTHHRISLAYIYGFLLRLRQSRKLGINGADANRTLHPRLASAPMIICTSTYLVSNSCFLNGLNGHWRLFSELLNYNTMPFSLEQLHLVCK
jgi:hypothetical protein